MKVHSNCVAFSQTFSLRLPFLEVLILVDEVDEGYCFHPGACCQSICSTIFRCIVLIFPSGLATTYTRRQQQSFRHTDMFFYLREYYIVRGTRCHLVVRIAVDSDIATRGKAICICKFAHQLTASVGRKNKGRRCCFRTDRPELKALREVVVFVAGTWIYCFHRQG